ncbi:hypothetical protein [Bdellovibrio sp. HCB337]|uniref:hypothetical protein n=1 Tax=Bdellovibrio sp. HCB337 TaxID=3394358 RepID=UPI0039A7382E
MKFTWFFALLGALALIALLVLLELGILQSPFAETSAPTSAAIASATSSTADVDALAKAQPPVKDQARFQEVYTLTQQGFIAKEKLARIVKTPLPTFEQLDNPHSVGTYKLRDEIALRVTALEALDKLAVDHPQEIQKILEDIAKTQTEPTLKFLVRVSLDGIYAQRPGKLSRTIDAMITEKEEL